VPTDFSTRSPTTSLPTGSPTTSRPTSPTISASTTSHPTASPAEADPCNEHACSVNCEGSVTIDTVEFACGWDNSSSACRRGGFTTSAEEKAGRYGDCPALATSNDRADGKSIDQHLGIIVGVALAVSVLVIGLVLCKRSSHPPRNGTTVAVSNPTFSLPDTGGSSSTGDNDNAPTQPVYAQPHAGAGVAGHPGTAEDDHGYIAGHQIIAAPGVLYAVPVPVPPEHQDYDVMDEVGPAVSGFAANPKCAFVSARGQQCAFYLQHRRQGAALPGMCFCVRHTCEFQGCTCKKSSTEQYCDAHRQSSI